MHFIAPMAAALALASGALATGQAKIFNNCGYSVWLTRSVPGANGTPAEMKSKASYSETISGSGTSLGLTKSADFYSPSTPKLVFGYSDTPPTVYYSVNAQDGTPAFGPNGAAGFTLAATGGCPGSSGYNGGKTLACADSQTISVTLC